MKERREGIEVWERGKESDGEPLRFVKEARKGRGKESEVGREVVKGERKEKRK